MALPDVLKRLIDPTTYPAVDTTVQLPPAASPLRVTPGEAGRVIRFDPAAARERYLELEDAEAIIRSHRQSWIPAAHALVRIKNRELYLGRYDSFEEYVGERWELWGIKVRQAYDYCRAAEVLDNVSSVDHVLSLAAAVQLAKLKSPAEQVECLREAIAAAQSKSPPAVYVAAAVAALTNPKRKRVAPKPTPIKYLAGKWKISAVPSKAGADLRELISAVREWLAQLEHNPQPHLERAGSV